MGKASEFTKKHKFVESLDSEVQADRQDLQDQAKKVEEVPVVAAQVPEIKPGAELGIDTDDDQILAVMNGYFKHINELEAEKKGGHLQDLVHRMANSMIDMPGGEKALRGALKGAVKGLSPVAVAANEDASQNRHINQQIAGLKSDRQNIEKKISDAVAAKKKMTDDKQYASAEEKIKGLRDQVAKLSDKISGLSKSKKH